MISLDCGDYDACSVDSRLDVFFFFFLLFYEPTVYLGVCVQTYIAT